MHACISAHAHEKLSVLGIFTDVDQWTDFLFKHLIFEFRWEDFS